MRRLKLMLKMQMLEMQNIFQLVTLKNQLF